MPSGATMQLELRDGSFDFTKLQSLANAMVEAGSGAERASSA